MSDAESSAQVLVNLRAHVVEVHMPDRVVVVEPLGTTTIIGTSPQVKELVRRGLVELCAPAADGTPAGDETPRGDGTPAGDETPRGDEDAGEQPATRKTNRARGSAATTHATTPATTPGGN